MTAIGYTSKEASLQNDNALLLKPLALRPGLDHNKFLKFHIKL